MSPSKKSKRRAHNGDSGSTTGTRDWALAFYKTSGGEAPARAFLLDCPQPVREMLLAIMVAVRDGPPPSFPPSRMWHVMRGDMRGIHEARDEHNGTLYRLFCIVDSQAPQHGLDAKVVTLISGGVKPARTAMAKQVYDETLAFVADYRATRRIVLPMGVPSGMRKG